MKKKQLLMATLVISLSAAVAVNWYYTKNPVTGDGSASSQSVTARLGDSVNVGATVASSQAENEDVPVEVEASSGSTASAEGAGADESESKSVMASADSFFTRERLKRDETYDEIVENLEDIAEKGGLTAEESAAFNDMAEKYARQMKTQSDTESLISAKTGGLCMVVINDEACQVILQKNTLNDRVILQISEIIEKNTNISAENLTIIEAK